MMRSLYNGSYAAATLRVSGQKENVFLLANPKAGEIEIYNSQGHKIDLKQNSMQLITTASQLQKLLTETSVGQTAGKVEKNKPNRRR